MSWKFEEMDKAAMKAHAFSTFTVSYKGIHLKCGRVT
jgi:hypothetical protein